MHGAQGWEAEPLQVKPFTLCAPPRHTSGKDVTAEDATRAGKGCNRARAAVKGSVREITSEKIF